MPSDFEDLLEAFLELRRDLDAHKVATAHMLRVGPVSDRDHGKGVRVNHGTEDAPDKSPWVQPAERSGVERDLPRIGEQLLVLAPYGDAEQGVTIPLGHSDAHPNPAADADESVIFNRDGCRASVKAGKLTWVAKEATIQVGKATLHMTEGATVLEVDGKSYTIDGTDHVFAGGKVKHDLHNIGATHTHGGIRSGGEHTDVPDL